MEIDPRVQTMNQPANLGIESGRLEETARNLVRAIPLLDRWMQTTLSHTGDSDISLRQLAVLQHIADEAATPGEIARSLNVTPAVITGLIDRLERRGFVRRFDSQFDRRRVHLELTVSGDDARVQANATLSQRMERQLSNLSASELATVDSAIQFLTDTLLTSAAD
jgi:DNA-binding MarR family transcriptional regulator